MHHNHTHTHEPHAPRRDAQHDDELIADLELALLLGGASPERAAERRRADARNAAAVVTLLIASAALMLVGLSRISFLAYAAGAGAFMASFVVDQRHQRRWGGLAAVAEVAPWP